MSGAVRLRALGPDAAEADVAWIAERMQRTLMEVVGREDGAGMYTLDWLRERVRFHLDPLRCRGAVYLAEDAAGERLGHVIVRVEAGDPQDPGDRGLFSTIWVEPSRRRSGVAGRLQDAGEAWMRAAGQERATTWTAAGNRSLILGLQKRGYAVDKEARGMVRLSRPLPRQDGSPGR